MSLIRRAWAAIRRAWDAWTRWWIRQDMAVREWEDVLRPVEAVTTGGMGFLHFLRALFHAILNR